MSLKFNDTLDKVMSAMVNRNLIQLNSKDMFSLNSVSDKFKIYDLKDLHQAWNQRMII